MEIKQGEKIILSAGEVESSILQKFDIRQPVFFADIYWDNLLLAMAENSIVFSELPRQNPVNRDLALIVEKSLPFETIEKAVRGSACKNCAGCNYSIFLKVKNWEGIRNPWPSALPFWIMKKPLLTKKLTG